MGREHGEKHLRVAPGEGAEGGFDLRFKRGHLPAFIVAPRVADEKVVGHGSSVWAELDAVGFTDGVELRLNF